ncbi:PD-(D/E)XK motif protein [Pedobacter africanus]|uniref:Putative PD-(D/E)XK family member n=1 Tax=Pedobacter africanus TaxID=151894 RepID=A0A1W2CUB4_9SPHI|nr:PD-(D/E)XK motif protein [Pedobacter africanus]SMC88472.1 Putative PD-(D/E)XK family member [Pedobacter africanus]
MSIINTSYLEEKWNSISKEDIRGYRIQRISPESKLGINIGLNHRVERCLILELPKDTNLVFFNRERQNLSIYHLREQGYIVIELLDQFFNDLFCDLIVSLYQRIQGIEDVEECSMELVASFNKWSEFLTDQSGRLLSVDDVKGLWGELFILRSLLNDSESSLVDETLGAWQGPYDRGHDFVLTDKNIEVKTRDASRIDISISSEYQLEPEFGKNLELLVLNVLVDTILGQSLLELVEDIRESIQIRSGDSSILLKALAQKGLNMRNIESYPGKYLAVSETVYDCMHGDFPKLNRNSIPSAINNLCYNIRTTGLDQFIIRQILY